METGDTNKKDNVGNIFDKLADGTGDTSLIPPVSIQRNAQSSMSNETSTESVFQHSLIQIMINAHSQQTLMFSKIMERIESGENSSRGKGEDIAAGQSNNTAPLTSLKGKSDNRDGSMPSTSKQSKTDADPVVVYDDISSAEEDVADSDSDDWFDTLEQEIPDRQEVPSENVDDLMKDWVTFYDDNDFTSPKVNEQLAKSIKFTA